MRTDSDTGTNLRAPDTIDDFILSFLPYSYSSGGEDGYVRIHYFDPQYFEFEFEA